MAREQAPLQRTILTPTQPVQSSSAFERMGNAVGQVGALISNKLNEIAVDKAAQQGALAVEEGKQPKDLAFPLTAATKAYNKAVADTEARRMVISAQGQMQEALINSTNPATFNSNTPARFSATLEGIIQGTLENTRNENREAVSTALLGASQQASLKMLQHSINFDNQQMKNDFSHDVQGLLNARRNAAIAGDEQQVSGIDEVLSRTLDDYSVMNEEIKRIEPDVRHQIEQQKTVDTVLSSFASASTEGQQAQFLSDFMQNKEGLPFDTWQQAAKQILSLDATEKQLTNEVRAQEGQEVSNGIQNGTIETPGDILLFPNLSVTQQLQKMSELQRHQQSQVKNQSKILQAQADIMRGNSAFISGGTADEMFDMSRAAFEQGMGRPMGIIDMEQSALGLNEFPASGIPGVPLGRNIPKLDAQITSLLTSGNPQQVIAAASVVKDMVDVRKLPNSVNLSGDALSIQSAFNTLDIGGLTTEERVALAQRVSDSVLNVKEPERAQRIQNFNQIARVDPRTGKSAMNDIYKDIFGTKPQPGVSDAAFGVMKENFKTHFFNTGSKEAAIAATKFDMKSWGESQYFLPGMVASVVPEKELNITNIGFAFDNQLKMKMQNLINKNKDNEQSNFKIDWLDPSVQTINFESLSDDDRVFKPIGTTQGTELETFTGRRSASIVNQKRPVVKINGHESEVFLMPTAESRLGDRVQYALFYLDQFGQQQPVPDNENPTGVAHFAPVGLERFAPKVFEGQQAERLKEDAVKIQQAQAKREWESIGALGKLGKLVPTIDTALKLGQRDKVNEIFTKMMGGDTQGVEEILRQKLQRNPLAIQEDASRAENVGIAADTGSDEGNQ